MFGVEYSVYLTNKEQSVAFSYIFCVLQMRTNWSLFRSHPYIHTETLEYKEWPPCI